MTHVSDCSQRLLLNVLALNFVSDLRPARLRIWVFPGPVLVSAVRRADAVPGNFNNCLGLQTFPGLL